MHCGLQCNYQPYESEAFKNKSLIGLEDSNHLEQIPPRWNIMAPCKHRLHVFSEPTRFPCIQVSKAPRLKVWAVIPLPWSLVKWTQNVLSTARVLEFAPQSLLHLLAIENILSITPRSTIPASQYIDSYTIAPRLDCQLDYASIAIWCFKCRSQLAYFDAREGIILVGYNRRRLHVKVIAGESIPRWVTRRDMVTKSDMVITGARKGPPLRLFFLGHAHQIHTAYVQPHDLQRGSLLNSTYNYQSSP